MSEQQYDNTDKGVMFPNDRKQNDRQPDFRGKGNFNGVEFQVSAWKKTGRNGNKFLSLAFSAPREGGGRQQADDLGDDW
jgi:uncharacterized protein (DUF736 family)